MTVRSTCTTSTSILTTTPVQVQTGRKVPVVPEVSRKRTKFSHRKCSVPFDLSLNYRDFWSNWQRPELDSLSLLVRRHGLQGFFGGPIRWNVLKIKWKKVRNAHNWKTAISIPVICKTSLSRDQDVEIARFFRTQSRFWRKYKEWHGNTLVRSHRKLLFCAWVSHAISRTKRALPYPARIMLRRSLSRSRGMFCTQNRVKNLIRTGKHKRGLTFV